MPVIKDIINREGERYENVVIPFTDGIKALQILAPLKKSLANDGEEVISAFEKNIALQIIDDAWKEHLRQMDDLKQSVQNAVYEQKDPLLIYKFEAFELFKKMIAEVNREVISFLFKANLPQTESPKLNQTSSAPKTDYSRMKTGRADTEGITNPIQNAQRQQQNGSETEVEEPHKLEPIRVGPKIGRNDPCSCGSGKKYKNCHGKDA